MLKLKWEEAKSLRRLFLCRQCMYYGNGKDLEIMLFAEETGDLIQEIVLFLMARDSCDHLPLRMFMNKKAYF